MNSEWLEHRKPQYKDVIFGNPFAERARRFNLINSSAERAGISLEDVIRGFIQEAIRRKIPEIDPTHQFVVLRIGFDGSLYPASSFSEIEGAFKYVEDYHIGRDWVEDVDTALFLQVFTTDGIRLGGWV